MTEQERTTGARQGCFCGGMPPMSETFKSCWSEETRGHFRSSRIEFWKGIRSIIDDRISRMSRGHQKGTSLTVE